MRLRDTTHNFLCGTVSENMLVYTFQLNSDGKLYSFAHDVLSLSFSFSHDTPCALLCYRCYACGVFRQTSILTSSYCQTLLKTYLNLLLLSSTFWNSVSCAQHKYELFLTAQFFYYYISVQTLK